jgi:hypothetical protein
LELRRHLARAEWWVAATAAAWCVGLLAFAVVTTPLWQPGQSTILVIAIGALGGLAMAATMAGITGWALTRLLGRERSEPTRPSLSSSKRVVEHARPGHGGE